MRDIVMERADHGRIPRGVAFELCFGKKKLVELGWQREEVYFRDHGTSKA